MKKLGRKGMALDFLGYLILALLVLAIGIFIYVNVTDKTIAGLGFVRDFLKWG